MDYVPIVLKNKGVPIELAVVRQNEDGFWERIYGEDGEFKTEIANIKFNHNVIADIEDAYGDLENWQRQQETRQSTTVRDTLAICLRREKRQIGEAMIEDQLGKYANSLGIAWSICNGLDPTVAGRLLRQADELAETQRKALNETFEKQMAEEKPKNSRGKTGSSSGSKQEETSTNSGS